MPIKTDPVRATVKPWLAALRSICFSKTQPALKPALKSQARKGVNFKFKHIKPNTESDVGEIKQFEVPIHHSNVKLI